MLELARAAAQQAGVLGRCSFVPGAFPDVAPEGGFEHAIVMGVMDYVRDADRFLRALRERVTRSAVISFPENHWFRAPLRRRRYQLLRRCDVYFYEHAQIVALLENAGFRAPIVHKIPGAGQDFVATAAVAS